MGAAVVSAKVRRMDLIATSRFTTDMRIRAFAVFQSAKTTSMPYVGASGLSEPLEACVGRLVRERTLRVKVSSGEEAENFHVLGDRTKDRAQS